jgi:hypothetical protein
MRVLFHRDYKGFTGGVLKVWHYFNHVRQFPGGDPRIYFSSRRWDERDPWRDETETVTAEWHPETADVLFLAGKDWRAFSASEQRKPTKPVINLIQHVRHAEPHRERYKYLSNRAIRICGSPEVENAIRSTGRVNGPIFTIPCGIDQETIRDQVTPGERLNDAVIVGLKQPNLARQLKALSYIQLPWLRGFRHRIAVLTKPMPRLKFLKKIAQSKITVFLPNRTEGFYIPALEGMLLETLVICPDSVGNRGFCVDGETCLVPEFTRRGLIHVLNSALSMSDDKRSAIRRRALDHSSKYSLAAERQAFHKILGNLDQIW